MKALANELGKQEKCFIILGQYTFALNHFKEGAEALIEKYATPDELPKAKSCY